MLFIILIFFLVLAFFGFSLLSCHFWPFTQVLRKIWPGVTRKMQALGCGGSRAGYKSRVALKLQAARLPPQFYSSETHSARIVAQWISDHG
jgi:hypothetical protein